MKAKCIKKCFHASKLWEVGETLEVSKGDKIPKHFVAPKDYKEPAVVDTQAKAAAAVGHKPAGSIAMDNILT